MKNILLGTNWKMHKTVQEAEVYTQGIIKLTQDYPEFQFFVIPPFTCLWQVCKLAQNTPLLVGAQNMHWEKEGPYTGEISATMLIETGTRLVELGHSERRQYFSETDYTVNKKVQAALKQGLIPLICIGETALEKEYGVSRQVVERQLIISLHRLSSTDVNNVWIAYEPVWAIGVHGTPAPPEYAGMMHTHIRNVLNEQYGSSIGDQVPILYGGSVNQENAKEFIAQPNVDGLFIGRSAWNVESFRSIAALLRT